MRYFLLNYAYEEGIRVDTGGYRKVWELSRHLCNAGHDAWVFIPEKERPEAEAPAPFVSYPVIEARILRPISAYFMLFWKPLLHARRHRPDYIYLRTAPTILPILLARLTGARLILEINGDSALEQRGLMAGIRRDTIHFLRVKLICMAEKMNARAAKVVIVLTEGLRKMVIGRYSVPEGKVVVVPSGTNTEHCRPMDRRECRALLQLDNDRMYVSFIGVLYAHQGIDCLIEAAPDVLKTHPDTVFMIGGGGPMKEVWQNTVRERDLQTAFRFPGVVPYKQLPIFLGAADICVAPFAGNRGEISPLKLFDYMACGRPVVSSDLPSIRTLIEESGAILAVPPDNSRALATAIVDLLSDAGKREKFGQAGRVYVESRHSWAAIARRTVDVIEMSV